MSTCLKDNQQKPEEQVLESLPLLQAYLECSDELQAHAREMIKIIQNPEIDEDDRFSALATLAEILFPDPHTGHLGMDLEESEAGSVEQNEESRRTQEEMDREEATFAEQLRIHLEKSGITQTELAAKIGVGQSAIAMMLQRNCRPQRRTVLKLASALGVSPNDLWPGFTG